MKFRWPFGLKITQLSSQFSVAGQITADDLGEIAEKGFRSIVNNRPDHEVRWQPRSDDLATAAAELGLVFVHIPIIPGLITENDVADFNSACSDLEGPVLMFCRSGARCTKLWQLSAQS